MSSKKFRKKNAENTLTDFTQFAMLSAWAELMEMLYDTFGFRQIRLMDASDECLERIANISESKMITTKNRVKAKTGVSLEQVTTKKGEGLKTMARNWTKDGIKEGIMLGLDKNDIASKLGLKSITTAFTNDYIKVCQELQDEELKKVQEAVASRGDLEKVLKAKLAEITEETEEEEGIIEEEGNPAENPNEDVTEVSEEQEEPEEEPEQEPEEETIQEPEEIKEAVKEEVKEVKEEKMPSATIIAEELLTQLDARKTVCDAVKYIVRASEATTAEDEKTNIQIAIGCLERRRNALSI